MAACGACGQTILFGAVRTKNFHFCNKKCRQNQPRDLIVADQISDDLCQEYAHELRQEDCPKCRGAGPLDIHTSRSVWSLLVYSAVVTESELCCRSCGVRGKIVGILFSLLLGWWGILGIVWTPLLIITNLLGMFGGGNSARPSAALVQRARLLLAAQYADAKESGELDTLRKRHTATINFTCPHCSFSKPLPASAEGMQGNCPSCKVAVTIRAETPTNS